MKKLHILAIALICTLIAASCSNGSSANGSSKAGETDSSSTASSVSAPTDFSKLCDIYIEIAMNRQEWTDAYRSASIADPSQKEALQMKMKEVADEVQAKNEVLSEKAKQLADKLLNSEMPCTTAPGLDYKVEKSTFTNIITNKNLTSLVITIVPDGEVTVKPYFLLLNGNGDVIGKTVGRYFNGEITVNFRITTDRGPAIAYNYSALRSLKLVTEKEYRAIPVMN